MLNSHANSLQVIFGLIIYTYYEIIWVNSYPTGAPVEACGGDVTDIVPNHVPHNASDNDDIPYSVSTHDFEYFTYRPGGYYDCKC